MIYNFKIICKDYTQILKDEEELIRVKENSL